MDPEPLIGMGADGGFDGGGAAGGVFEGVAVVVAGGDEGDFGAEAEDVAALGGFPYKEARENGCAGAESDAGES